MITFIKSNKRNERKKIYTEKKVKVYKKRKEQIK